MLPVLAVFANANDTNLLVNDSFEVNVSAVNASGQISYTVSYGDAAVDTRTSSSSEKFVHSYLLPGNYTINVSAQNNGSLDSVLLQVGVASSQDTSAPELALLSPSNNAVLESSAQLVYNASDPSLFSCNLSLLKEAADVGSNLYLVQEARYASGLQNTALRTESFSLEDGKYSWFVKCTDSANNSIMSTDLFFTVDTAPDTVEEVAALQSVPAGANETLEAYFDQLDTLVNDLDAVLLGVQQFGDKEREVADLVGLEDQLMKFKKSAQSLKRDINNVKFRKDLDDAGKEAAREEFFNRAEQLKSEIPRDLHVVSEEEFVKYDLANPLPNITRAYLQYLGKKLSDKQFNASADFFVVDITYLDETQKTVTIIHKKANPLQEKVLEVIPKSLAASSDEVKVYNDFDVVQSDPIFEIIPLDGGYTYQLSKGLSLKDVQGIDSLVFSEPDPEALEKSLITGFSVFSGGVDIGLHWAAAIIAMLLLTSGSAYYLLRDRVKKQELPPSVHKLESLIFDARRFLELNQVDKVTVLYDELKTVYGELPVEFKQQFYLPLLKIYGEIDSSYLFNLLVEAHVYVKNNDLERASELYDVIQDVYRRLPEDKKRLHYTSCVELLKKLEG